MRRLTPSQLMAFADHVYAASEGGTGAASERVEDTMTAEDRKEQFGEKCEHELGLYAICKKCGAWPPALQ